MFQISPKSGIALFVTKLWSKTCIFLLVRLLWYNFFNLLWWSKITTI